MVNGFLRVTMPSDIPDTCTQNTIEIQSANEKVRLDIMAS